MPNWVKTDIEITNGDLDGLLKKVKSKDSLFDLNNIIPMPKELDIESSSLGTICLAWLLSEQGTKELTYGELMGLGGLYLIQRLDRYVDLKFLTDRIKPYTQEKLKKGMGLAEKYLANIKNTGYLCWCDWRVNNWGTKWNTCEADIHDNVITMEHAWSFPQSVIDKVFEEFNITADVKVLDEGYCFWGVLRYVDGDLVTEEWEGSRDRRIITQLIYGGVDNVLSVDTNKYQRSDNWWDKESKLSNELVYLR